VQAPPLHTFSPPHGVPSVASASAGQSSPTPSQRSSASQGPAEARHSTVAGLGLCAMQEDAPQVPPRAQARGARQTWARQAGSLQSVRPLQSSSTPSRQSVSVA